MIEEPKCYTRKCKHFLGVKSDGLEINERVYCVAFPNRIPDEIAYGRNKHNEPFKGDHGVLYEREKS